MSGRPALRDTPGFASPLADLDGFAPYLMNRIVSRLNQRMTEELRQRGLTFQHWRVLLILANRRRRTVNALADDTVIPQSTLSRLLMRMEKGGFVRRLPHGNDSRLVEAEITDKGRATFAEILPFADACWAEVTATLDATDQQTLSGLLRRMMIPIG